MVKAKAYWAYGRYAALSILLHRPWHYINKILATESAFALLEQTIRQQQQQQQHTNLINKIKEKLHIAANNKEISDIIGESTNYNNVSNHQGIAVLTQCIKQPSLADVLKENTDNKANNKSPHTGDRIIILDKITDSGNIGAIIRTASAFSIKNIVCAKHNAPTENSTIIKAAAGTFDLVNFVHVPNISDAIHKLKTAGYWIIGLDGATDNPDIEYATSMYKNDHIALVLGCENKGISRLVKKHCDLLVKVKMDPLWQGDTAVCDSLNVSNAAAISMYLFTK